MRMVISILYLYLYVTGVVILESEGKAVGVVCPFSSRVLYALQP